LCPLADPHIRDYVGRTLLGTYLRNDKQTTMLRADGRYERISGQTTGSTDPQEVLLSIRQPERNRD
jgi:hypothetical protein